MACPWKDSPLACRAGAVSEVEFRSRWSGVCPEAVAAAGRGAWVGWAEACPCGGCQEQPGKQKNAKTGLNKRESGHGTQKGGRWVAGGRGLFLFHLFFH